MPAKLFFSEMVPGDPVIRTMMIEDPTEINYALYQKMMSLAAENIGLKGQISGLIQARKEDLFRPRFNQN